MATICDTDCTTLSVRTSVAFTTASFFESNLEGWNPERRIDDSSFASS
jgi:hypothetical protein